MASTTFVDGSTVVQSSWLNDVNSVTYGTTWQNTGTITPVAGYDTVPATDQSIRSFGPGVNPINNPIQAVVNNIQQIRNDRAFSNNPVLTGTLTFGNIIAIPGSPVEGPGGNAFNGGILTHKTSGNYQVAAYQVQPTTASLKPEWGPISEFVVCRTTDQSTNFQRLSFTAMSDWAGPALNDAATDYRFQQEAGGSTPLLPTKFTAQYNTTGLLYEHMALMPDGNVHLFRRSDAPAVTADNYMLLLEAQARATAPVLTSAGQQDSPKFQIAGKSYDTALHTASWRQFVDMTSNAGGSSYRVQQQLDTLGWNDILTLTDTKVVSGPVGFTFPATQVPSADPNTLDDYEEGTWSPNLTFATPGDVSFAGTTISGDYIKIGRRVTVWITFIGTITHTTASGNLQIDNLPFTSVTKTGYVAQGGLRFQGITKAGFTNFTSQVGSNSVIANFNASGSGVARAAVVAADVPTGGVVEILTTLEYITAN